MRSPGVRAGQGLRIGLAGLLALLAAVAGFALAMPEALEFLLSGDTRKLDPLDPGASPSVSAPASAPASAPDRPRSSILFIALDGVDRDLLYDLLARGELPEAAALLGGGGPGGGALPHAHLDRTLLATLPSTTIAAWATVMTGAPPSTHGVTGNEFFLRESRRFAAPAPVTIDDPAPVLSNYTDGYANRLLAVPTVYERMREEDPDVVVWSSMLQFYAGADLLLTAHRTVLVDAFAALAGHEIGGSAPGKALREVFEELDSEVVETVVEELEDSGVAPDVLTVYLAGTDLYAHRAPEGPDEARRTYLREVTDPLLGELRRALEARGALADRFVVITSDHGHTEVVHDDAHALSTEGPDEPPAVLRAAGFRVRPFELEVEERAPGGDFQAVLAYQGAIAYVYLADRSTCVRPGEPCAWSRPPRFEADVLEVADAFFRASATGEGAPGMRGTLDLVLARRPRPQGEDDMPFSVYVGEGRLEELGAFLEKNPRPQYVALERRMRDLAAGPLGERAGDVLLLAHSGDRKTPEERYYFASEYHSWHGSPGRKDSEVPLVVAHPRMDALRIRALVEEALGPPPRLQQRVTDVLLALRRAAP